MNKLYGVPVHIPVLFLLCLGRSRFCGTSEIHYYLLFRAFF